MESESPSQRDQPTHTLDPRAIFLWRVREAAEMAVLVLIAAAITTGLIVGTDLHLALAILPVLLALVATVVDLLVVPPLLWKQWRYRVGDLEVDIQRGLWTITRTRVPMARIQHVDTRRGPLERRYGLATVVLYTAAGANQIPFLAVVIADSVRDRIAELANTRDDV